MSDATTNPLFDRYVTPTTPPTSYQSRRFCLPDDRSFLGAVSELLSRLVIPEVWKGVEGITPDDAVQLSIEMMLSFFGVYKRLMIGQVVMYLGDVPDNVLPMNGETHLREHFPLLWSVLPSGMKTISGFTLPDMRERFPLGAGDFYEVGDTGGSSTHTLTEAEIPSHAHTYSPQVIFNLDLESAGVPDINGAGVSPFQGVTNYTGGGGSHNNMPPFFVLNFGIIARVEAC